MLASLSPPLCEIALRAIRKLLACYTATFFNRKAKQV